ncbi:hypothetical protein [Paracoccus sp. Ld10]|uniref:hypothetical protein n=1 Tax=Paracoccus sp. Ld10 TaxID=649158 RepID=UPI00386AB2EC
MREAPGPYTLKLWVFADRVVKTVQISAILVVFVCLVQSICLEPAADTGHEGNVLTINTSNAAKPCAVVMSNLLNRPGDDERLRALYGGATVQISLSAKAE